MYFITGGTFNGKGRWVRNHFRLENSNTEWVPLFNGALVEIHPRKPIVVLEGLEYAIRVALSQKDGDIRAAFKAQMHSLKKWEAENPERKVIWIGSEIGKGIVPVDQSSREWRDMTGWVYQDLAQMSQRVWLVWYGMATSLKG